MSITFTQVPVPASPRLEASLTHRVYAEARKLQIGGPALRVGGLPSKQA